MARKTDEGRAIDAFIAREGTPHREVLQALREAIRAAGPGLREAVKWGQPTFVGRGNVCYLASYSDHVNLGFYRGAELHDPRKLLEGTGKALRHVKVRSLEQARSRPLRDLIREAVALDSGRARRRA